MMKKPLTLFIGFIALCSCSKSAPEKDQPPFKTEVDQLSNCEELKAYLDEINVLDQKYRVKEGEISAKYGNNSKEYKMIWELINLTDQQNLKKVDLIFQKFDYPTEECVGRLAATAPLMVLHHTLDHKERREYFPLLYKHYLKGNLDGDLFTLFLERMYQFKHDRYFKMLGPYKEKEKIDTLIKVLNLSAEINKARSLAY